MSKKWLSPPSAIFTMLTLILHENQQKLPSQFSLLLWSPPLRLFFLRFSKELITLRREIFTIKLSN
jgi:hypothetical protein